MMRTFLKRFIPPFFISFLFLSASAKGQRMDGTNTVYEEGDWISYMQSRYVHSLQIGPEIVYIATEGGILRYDFYARKWLFPFTTSNGLAENYIITVAYDVITNLLWCSTSSAVCVYNPTSRTWQNHYFDDLELPANDPITSIGFSNTGTYLMSKSGAMYFSPIDQYDFTFTRNDTDSSLIWFGRRGFDRPVLDQYFLSNSWIFIDDAQEYYIQDTNLRKFRLSYYVIDSWNTLWAGTAGRGLFEADTRVRHMTHLPFGLLNPSVRAILIEKNILWAAGISNSDDIHGISHWNQINNQWEYIEPRLISRFRNGNILDIEPALGSIWFATEDGLMRYLPQNDSWQTFTVFDGLQDNQIHKLSGSDSLLWVATNDGLDCLTLLPDSKDSISVRPVTNPKDKTPVYDVLIDGDNVWAGTGYGLFYSNRALKKSGYYRGTEGSGAETIVAVEKYGDSLWVAAVDRIEIYDLKNKRWVFGPGRKSFTNIRLLDLVVTQNAVWVGTDQGLYKHRIREGYWKQFTQTDGLLHSRVQKIFVDGDYLWIGSSSGLTRFYWNAPYRID